MKLFPHGNNSDALKQTRPKVLLIPVVPSIGNVPQLAAEMACCSASKKCKPVGYLESKCVYPFAGTFAFSRNWSKVHGHRIHLALELFQLGDGLLLLQQRSPPFKERWLDFAKELERFIANEIKPDQIILLHSRNSQYFESGKVALTRISSANEQSSFKPTPDQDEEMVHLLVEHLSTLCHDIQILSVASAEGDNREEAVILFKAMSTLIDPKGETFDTINPVIPESWAYIFGPDADPWLYR